MMKENATSQAGTSNAEPLKEEEQVRENCNLLRSLASDLDEVLPAKISKTGNISLNHWTKVSRP